MSAAEDFGDQIFGPLADHEKTENFERSTLKLVLKQLGWPAARVAHEDKTLGPAFGWDWFNDLNLVSPTRVGSTRIFEFNFDELLTKSRNHPITEAFREFEQQGGPPCCLVFKVHDRGRWIATDLNTEHETAIQVVAGTFRFSVLPFTNFFSNRWSTSDE